MKRNMSFSRLSPVALILGLAMSAVPSWATVLTPPALQISYAGSTIVMDSAGLCFSSLSPLTTVTCPAGIVVAAGTLTFNGTFAGITFVALEGQSKPALVAPQTDLLIGAIVAPSAGGTLSLEWTDVGFTVGSSPGTLNATVGGATTAYTGYYSTSNTPFGLGTEVGTTAGGIVSGGGPATEPFSMTEVETITLPTGGAPIGGDDFSLAFAPTAPLALKCGSATTGTVGTAYSSSLVASGGAAPFTYSIISGSLGSSLSLNSTTGLISGTPTASGTLTFTAQVMDSGGTATAACSIVISPASSTTGQSPSPLKVTCPTSTATVGTPYSSTPVATGGYPPYTYSVAFGTLPAGLTLNSKTGLISGTPTTASQTGAFKIEVTDSKGDIAYTNCSGTCSTGVSVSYGGGQSQGGYGDKGSNSASYSSNGIPINCYGFSTTGSKNDLYSNNVQGNSLLGLTNWSNNNQIDTQHFVQFDISSHTSSGATGGSIAVSTLDWNASFDVYGSNTQGSIGTLLASNLPADSNLKSIPNCTQYHYICVKAHSGDCLISCVSFSYPCACSIDVSQAQSSGGWGQGGGNNGGYGSGSGSGYSSGWGQSGFGQSGGGQNGNGEGSNPGQCGW